MVSKRSAVEGAFLRDAAFPVGQVHDVISDVDAMGVLETPLAPRANVVAFAIKNHDWRLGALEGVNAILGVCSDGADGAEGHAIWQSRPVFDYLIGILAAPYSSQSNCLLDFRFCWVKTTATILP